MKNFQVIDKNTNKEYWISRSIAVCAIVIVTDKDCNKYILINQRGSGTPDFQHCWNIPCGYLDWDETLSEACTREVLEECKCYIDPRCWMYHHDAIQDTPDSNRQNVTIRKYAFLSMEEYETAKAIGYSMNNADGEENEVEGIELMPLTLYNLYEHKWAFNHEDIIKNLMNG